jgi:hypothetical protein
LIKAYIIHKPYQKSNMKNSTKKYAIVLVLAVLAMTGCSKGSDNGTTPPADKTRGVHFKAAGKQYDLDSVRAIYDPASKIFLISNIVVLLPADTSLALAIGSDFSGSTGTFKGDDNNKGFVFHFLLFGGSVTNPIAGYEGGQNDANSVATVANTPVSITLTSFSYSGSEGAPYGNVTAHGTFSGTVYDVVTNAFVAITDGTFTVHP